MKTLVTIVLLLLAVPSYANSFNEKLNELFELTGVRNYYVNLNNILINQMQSGYFQAADQTIDSTGFTEEQKKQAGEILRNRFGGMVRNYQEFVQKSMSYDKVTREVYIPLYKEIYSEREIDELLKFYKSPIGKKTIEVSKSISEQSSKRSADRYDALIVDFIEKQVRENIAIAQKEIAEQVN